MIGFIVDNIGTVAVSALLLTAVLLACTKIYKDKKSGKSSCGGSCGSCPYSSGCGKNKSK